MIHEQQNTRPTMVAETDEPTQAFLDTQALLDERQDRGTLIPGDFADLHRRVSDIHTALDASDIDRPLDEASLRYLDGRAALRFRRPDGAWDSPLSFTGAALSQMGLRVLGSGGLKYLERKRQRGVTGAKLAEICWADDMVHQAKPSLLRTVQLPDQPYRTIRGVLSGGGRGYQTFDGVDLVDTLASLPEFAGLPVIESRVTLDHTRIRFLLDPADAALFDSSTGKLRNPTNSHDTGLNLMVPMCEVGVGEIGNGSTYAYGCGYQYRCLNGLGSWSGDSAKWRWTHAGHNQADRVRAGLADALTSIRLTASGVVADYNRSVEVAVEDAWALLDSWGVQAGQLTQRQARRAHEAQDDESCTRGRNIARIVDGITLAAQEETDILQQRSLEQFAHRLMVRGIRNGHQNGGRVVLETAEA